MQKNVLEYLENSVKKYPNKIAFADDEKEYTYFEFDEIAKKIAIRINEKIKKYNKPIAVFVDRKVESLIGFMAVLYSGNYYVPIDNKMPKQRIEMVLNTVKPAAILYSSNDENMIKEIVDEKENIIIPILETSNEVEVNEEKLENLKEIRKNILDVDPVYIIFTSGSTGTPKGIVISHRSVIDFTDWMAETFDMTSEDVMANQAPFYFDLSVKDIYTTLKCGATTHIIPRKILMFPILLVKFLNEKRVTACIWATSAFRLLSQSKVFEKNQLETVKKVILGGEALMAKDLNNWRRKMPEIQYVNLYGPTEVTVDCTYYKIDKEFKDDESIPIGKACENKEVILLTDDLKEAKVGESGEICVRGTGLAKGYFGDKEKTDGVFIQNPLNENYLDLLYKTGDIGIKKEDGLIYFQARKDAQIKHMGYRIELGEIERAISSIEKINEVICFYDELNKKIVCVFQGGIQEAEIVEKLKEKLPKYMFPNVFRKQLKMPYNANGKIDRVKLKKEYFEK